MDGPSGPRRLELGVGWIVHLLCLLPGASVLGSHCLLGAGEQPCATAQGPMQGWQVGNCGP